MANVIEILQDLLGRHYKLPVEVIENPFAKGNLTSDGIQYCTELTTTAANVNNDVEIVTVGGDMPSGRLIAIELGLTGVFAAATSATADLIYQWAIKNLGVADWTNLHSAVTKTNLGTGDTLETYSGNFAKVDANGVLPGVNRVPFQVKLMIQCNEANEGQAKTKNSSRVKYLYIPD